MSRILLALALLSSSVALSAQDEMPLQGRIEGRTYVSPTGAFKIAIPVLPELGGRITDTENVVTFQDAFNVHLSIAVFPQDLTQRWELSTRGTKDYLAYFFMNVLMEDFRRAYPDTKEEKAVYVSSLQGGALFAYMLIPGGSMFMDRVAVIGAPETLPVAKRGNLLFIRGNDIYVISTELAERVIEGKTYKKTAAEEDQLLRQRLEDIVSKMQFLKPLPKPAESTSTSTPATPAAPAKAAAAPAPATAK